MRNIASTVDVLPVPAFPSEAIATDVPLFNCNLSNNPVSIEVDTKYKCMEEQTFNSVVKIREDAFITATDKGKLLVLKKVQNN